MHSVLFEIAGLRVRSYGVALAIAFVIGIFVAMHRGRRAGLDPERILDLGLVLLVTSIAGARLLYVATFLEEFRPPQGSWVDVFVPSGQSGVAGLAATCDRCCIEFCGRGGCRSRQLRHSQFDFAALSSLEVVRPQPIRVFV